MAPKGPRSADNGDEHMGFSGASSGGEQPRAGDVNAHIHGDAAPAVGSHDDVHDDGGTSGYGSSPLSESEVDGSDVTEKASGQGGPNWSEIAGNAGSGLGKLGYGLVATAARTGQGGARFAKRLFTKIGTMFMTAGTSIAGWTGGAVSPKVGAGIAGGGAFGLLMATVMFLGSILVIPMAYRDGSLECEVPEIEDPNVSQTADGGDAEENAKKVYSILKYAGMSDENIAGILGNWSVESGVDPTSVETIHNEPYTLGPRKLAAQAADFRIEAIDAGYAAKYPLIMRAGIGLGQWTDINPGPGGRNTMLRDFAKDKGGDWYELEIQMAFMLGGDDPMRVAVVQDMIDNSKGNPEAATEYFFKKWEGAGDSSGPTRAQAASEWYAKMSGWEVDSSLGASVLAMANVSKGQASVDERNKALQDCAEQQNATAGGNESLAEAAVTYAYPYSTNEGTPNGHGDNGTELYQFLHDEIFPGDPYYQSCDRGVAVAVRWSGSDDAFPAGPTDAQYAYFMGEGGDKWEEVQGIDTEDNLEPGDVLVTKGNGHIQLYVGNEIVEKVWAGKPHTKNAVIVSASYMERSPGLQNWNDYITDGRPYSGWRLKEPEQNSKYKGITIPAGMKTGPDYV